MSPADLPADSPLEATSGDFSSAELFDAVYARLKAMASTGLSGKNSSPTLDTTALVHDLYLRMGKHDLRFDNPARFFSYAARAMRHLLADRVRDRLRQRAGGDWQRVTFTQELDAPSALETADEAIALEEALTRLEQEDERAARVVELRYFVGLNAGQAAEVLGITRRTADRDWRFARAFLENQLS